MVAVLQILATLFDRVAPPDWWGVGVRWGARKLYVWEKGKVEQSRGGCWRVDDFTVWLTQGSVSNSQRIVGSRRRWHCTVLVCPKVAKVVEWGFCLHRSRTMSLQPALLAQQFYYLFEVCTAGISLPRTRACAVGSLFRSLVEGIPLPVQRSNFSPATSLIYMKRAFWYLKIFCKCLVWYKDHICGWIYLV